MKIERLLICLLLAASTLSWSCLKNESGKRAPAGFDFAMNKVVGLTVNYNADLTPKYEDAEGNAYDYHMIFDVYTEYPFTSADRTAMKEGVSPILSVFTDAQGRFTGKMKLPIATTKLWFHSKTLGVPRLIEVDVPEGGTVSLNLTSDITNVAAVRSSRAASHTFPADLNLMSTTFDWNIKGLPTGVPDPGKWNGNDVRTTINTVFKEGVNLHDKYSSLLNATPVFKMTKPNGAHTVILRFAHNDGTKKSTIAYYTYMEGQQPTSLDNVKLTLAMPNASYNNSTDQGPFKYSDGVQLFRWTGSGYDASFPKGCCIAFVVLPDGFDPATGNINDGVRYYANKEFNTNGKQQLAAFYNGGNNVFIGGVEYADRSVASTDPGDNDFSDLIFFVDAMPRQDGVGQLVPVDPKPEDPPVEDPVYPVSTTKGTLIFEDLWPWQGDYDLNDVVLEYTCEVYVNENNRVIKMVDKFRPMNCGATLQNGFAIQYGFAPSAPKKMTMVHNYPGGTSKTDAKSPYVPIPWTTDPATGYETGQSKACVLLFDDIRRENANIASGAYTWTITTEFEAYLPSLDEIGLAPYNPFIIVHHGMDDDLRNHEIHIANYEPTDKGTMKWFRTANDVSNPPVTYYITNAYHPFAIDIPMHGFVLAPEKSRIESVYSNYAAWAASRGTLHTDWYKYPNIP